jgi:thymidylate kinase
LITISLCGIDGSGKSTLARELLKILSNGLKVKIVWFRWRAFLTYALYLYSKIKRHTIMKFNPRTCTYIKVHRWNQDPLLKATYHHFLIIDMLLYYIFIQLIARLSQVDILIFDRFFIDALVDAIYETKNKTILKSFPSKIVYLHVKRISYCVILDIPPEIAWQRKKDILSMREVSYKRGLYKSLATILGLPVLSGALPPKKLCEVILTTMERICNIRKDFGYDKLSHL